MIKKPAQTGRIVAADFKTITGFMAGTAVALYVQYFANDFIADTRIICHRVSPFLD
jgi:hypothetical protein